VLLWIWIAVVVLALIILGIAIGSVVGRLGGLRRAAVKLQRRQEEAMRLRAGATELERSVLGLQQRAEVMQGRVESIQAGLGRADR
jgi:type II secretory pathway pseudopilin PulG